MSATALVLSLNTLFIHPLWPSFVLLKSRQFLQGSTSLCTLYPCIWPNCPYQLLSPRRYSALSTTWARGFHKFSWILSILFELTRIFITNLKVRVVKIKKILFVLSLGFCYANFNKTCGRVSATLNDNMLPCGLYQVLFSKWRFSLKMANFLPILFSIYFIVIVEFELLLSDKLWCRAYSLYSPHYEYMVDPM